MTDEVEMVVSSATAEELKALERNAIVLVGTIPHAPVMSRKHRLAGSYNRSMWYEESDTLQKGVPGTVELSQMKPALFGQQSKPQGLKSVCNSISDCGFTILIKQGNWNLEV
jgi:hypothetical protein